MCLPTVVGASVLVLITCAVEGVRVVGFSCRVACESGVVRATVVITSAEVEAACAGFVVGSKSGRSFPTVVSTTSGRSFPTVVSTTSGRSFPTVVGFKSGRSFPTVV